MWVWNGFMNKQKLQILTFTYYIQYIHRYESTLDANWIYNLEMYKKNDILTSPVQDIYT